ncbi:MAG: hypothetical protein U5K33_08745 [Halofilum sp. (in: g-proteobacteria)]|nr:hypothetical protein [Halofilum sp. (in: g-proteobacteria)]
MNVTVEPDFMPVADDDSFTVEEDGPTTTVNVLANDSFGGNGPGNTAITITSWRFKRHRDGR